MKYCNITFLAAPVLSGLFAWPALAQETGDHHDDGGEIVVTAIYARNEGDLLAGTSVLKAEELARDLRPSIGETLTRQPGVSATSFGPNASRPVLRGFQGERVRVLADGIGSFDVSNTSVDHAVAINPLTADRIEVLRGPSALLFGSAAIGGVVNVIDSRIPRTIPEEAVHVDGSGTFGTAANERSLGGRFDLKLSSHLVAHLDGNWSKSDDLRTGGFILAPALRAQAAASGEPEKAALALLKGELPNSAGQSWELAGGLAWIGDYANFGFSVSRYDNLYDVPVRYATAAGDPPAEAVSLDAKQWRGDLRGEVDFSGGFLESVKFRGGYADYRHNELDETGAVGTQFRARGNEARLEFIQRKQGAWRGAFGLQYFRRRLNIIGDEKFLPRSLGDQLGLFTLQSLDLGTARLEAGGRIEHSRARADADIQLGTAKATRAFTALSGSVGGNIDVASGWRIGLNASYSERAPSVEELFPNGPHAGTQAFEIGNPAFGKERAKGLELTVRGKAGPVTLSASLFHSWFDHFIYEEATGTTQDDLPVFQFRQDRARYLGGELEAELKLGTVGGFDLSADAIADFTRATIIRPGANQPAPRIPAERVLAGLSADSDRLALRAEVERVGGQSRTARLETTTPGYTLVNLSATIRPSGKDGPLSILLSADNLFDVVARRHASFLKDYAPLSGRDFRITIKYDM